MVVSAFPSSEGRALQTTKKADATQVSDLMETTQLLCYPIYLRGLRLCAGEDWHAREYPRPDGPEPERGILAALQPAGPLFHCQK